MKLLLHPWKGLFEFQGDRARRVVAELAPPNTGRSSRPVYIARWSTYLFNIGNYFQLGKVFLKKQHFQEISPKKAQGGSIQPAREHIFSKEFPHLRQDEGARRGVAGIPSGG
jgi:hypothetical protein